MSADTDSLRRSFNESARLYDQMRPGYPAALIEDAVSLSEIPERGSILEIGCGTGQATRPFAERGYSMLCLDIGERLAAIAARKFRRFENVTVVVQSFEEWQTEGKMFDLVMAATSFLWIAPDVRWVKSAFVLKPSGALALLWNQHVRKDEGFFAEVQAVYKKCAPSLDATPAKTDDLTVSTEDAGLFETPVRRTYPWTREYTAEDYIRLLNTYSGHIVLPENERKKLFEGVKDLINQKYGGAVVKHYEAVLELRRRKA